MMQSEPTINKVDRNVTFKEITGGNIQTTTLRAKLNGNDIGKFNNVTRSMASNDEDEAIKVLTYLKENGYSIAGKKKPHAEDYLIAYSLINWESYRSFLKSSDNVLSIAMDKSPCIVCAQNLHKFANSKNLRLRIKAGFHYEATKKRGVTPGQTGTEYLEEKKIPIRSWPLKAMVEKLSGTEGDVKATMIKRFEISLKNFKINQKVKPEELGWKSIGYSRQYFSDNVWGKGWTKK